MIRLPLQSHRSVLSAYQVRALSEHAYSAFAAPFTDIEIAVMEREEMYNRTFTIVFTDPEYEEYEEDIRSFCEHLAHPSVMFFLHLPVNDTLTLDCEWDEDRDLMIFTELDEDDAVTLQRRGLH